MNCVGIDVSKGKSMIAVMRPFGEVVVSPFEVLHTDSELSKLAGLLKSLDGETARGDFLRKVSQEKAQAIEAAPAKEKAEAKPEEVTAPDPDKA